MTNIDVLEQLEQAIKVSGGRQRWCDANGLSNQYLSDVCTMKVGIGPSILKALKIKRIFYYEKIEENCHDLG